MIKVSAKPLVTLITPAYNEEAILVKSIEELCDYMKGLEGQYRWEVLIVNDGSKDNTAQCADEVSARHENVRVHHHETNKNLGGAMQTGFRLAKGDIVIVLDIDLSYAPEHIERLLAKMEETNADLVIASPYLKGGKCTKVPTHRLVLSKVVNYFMRKISGENIYTFTSMVRAYKKDFLTSLNLKSHTYSIMPEIIYKGLILRKKIVEIPAHLDWSFQVNAGTGRASSMRIIKGIFEGLMNGFIFRPYAFFFAIGVFFMLISGWVIGWIFVHTFTVFPTIETTMINDRFSEAVAQVFNQRPHAFFIGGTSLIVSLLFLGIGFLSLQSKRYFDELFHLGSSINKRTVEMEQRTENPRVNSVKKEPIAKI